MGTASAISATIFGVSIAVASHYGNATYPTSVFAAGRWLDMDNGLPKAGESIDLPCPKCPGNKKLNIERLKVPDPRFAWSYVRGSSGALEPSTEFRFNFGTGPPSCGENATLTVLEYGSPQGGLASPTGVHRSAWLELSRDVAAEARGLCAADGGVLGAPVPPLDAQTETPFGRLGDWAEEALSQLKDYEGLCRISEAPPPSPPPPPTPTATFGQCRIVITALRGTSQQSTEGLVQLSEVEFFNAGGGAISVKDTTNPGGRHSWKKNAGPPSTAKEGRHRSMMF